jgi:hypothetical protein
MKTPEEVISEKLKEEITYDCCFTLFVSEIVDLMKEWDKVCTMNEMESNYMQLCPKCNGQGIVSKPPWIAGDVNQWMSDSAAYECDVCNGKKIVEYKLIKS